MISPTTTSNNDPLGFEQVAANLAGLILGSKDSTPLTIGIESGWGRGKSTLMKRLERALQGEEVRTTAFNAWTAPEGEALEGLVKSVLSQLDRNILRRAARSQNLLSWTRALSSGVASVFGFGSIVETLWKQLSTDPKARNEVRAVVDRSMRLWAKRRARQGQEQLLVVFVDDLDRCSPVNVLQVFEAIKLYLDASGLVFVIGYDRDVVSDAILGLKQYRTEATSHHYVEKIVQLVYRLPSVSDAAANRLLDLYVDKAGTRELFAAATRTLTIEQNERNPRRIKRFINAFILEFGLDAEWAEIGPETLVRVLIIDLYFPDFGQLLRSRVNRDPVKDFRDYVAVREILRTRSNSPADRERVEQLFDSWRLVPPSDEPASALADLDAALPAFSKVANNPEFSALLDGLHNVAGLREKLLRFTPASVVRSGPVDVPIYLSYRRADAGDSIYRLVDELSLTIDRTRILFDVATIGASPKVGVGVESAVEGSIVLAIIGPGWFSEQLHSPIDWVHRELSIALHSANTVIPILINRAQMPRVEDLPDDLVPLVERQALRLNEETWTEDVRRLVEAIEYRRQLAIPPTGFSAMTPPNGTLGGQYAYMFAANGVPTPRYTVASGSVPPGLVLTLDGLLEGTPSTVGGWVFAVRATNSSGTVTSPDIYVNVV